MEPSLSETKEPSLTVGSEMKEPSLTVGSETKEPIIITLEDKEQFFNYLQDLGLYADVANIIYYYNYGYTNYETLLDVPGSIGSGILAGNALYLRYLRYNFVIYRLDTLQKLTGPTFQGNAFVAEDRLYFYNKYDLYVVVIDGTTYQLKHVRKLDPFNSINTDGRNYIYTYHKCDECIYIARLDEFVKGASLVKTLVKSKQNEYAKDYIYRNYVLKKLNEYCYILDGQYYKTTLLPVKQYNNLIKADWQDNYIVFNGIPQYYMYDYNLISDSVVAVVCYSNNNNLSTITVILRLV